MDRRLRLSRLVLVGCEPEEGCTCGCEPTRSFHRPKQERTGAAAAPVLSTSIGDCSIPAAHFRQEPSLPCRRLPPRLASPDRALWFGRGRTCRLYAERTHASLAVAIAALAHVLHFLDRIVPLFGAGTVAVRPLFGVAGSREIPNSIRLGRQIIGESRTNSLFS